VSIYFETGELPGTIDVFFRTVIHRHKMDDTALPYLLYLQGGPGFESPRPMDGHSGWLKYATNYFRVVLMDQRGTGLSAGITAESLQLQGSPENQAKYLKCFRADSIVRDSEAIRNALLLSGPDNGNLGHSGDSRWSLLGQSFGGFCCTTYLSMAPQGLSEVLMTGGLPPGISLPCSAVDVYRRTFQRVLGQNSKFYARFPAAEHRARQVVSYLSSLPSGNIETPAGNILSPRSFQLLGLQCLGFSHGLERLNYLLESAMDPTTGAISQRFMKDFDSSMAWDTNPLYAILHESIYCQGAASHWAAHRVRENEFKDDFDAVKAVHEGRPVLFTGEMVFPWMFDEFKELRKIKEAAELIANETNWPNLYDKHILASNTVAVAAASYFEDMFVDFELAQETAKSIQGIRQLVTSEWLHDGIKENGAAIFEKLLNMARGGVLLR
jgi:pimeloyl-ACP methyl ester carboxylesterase